MAQIYDANDLFWTARGDIIIGSNGDIQDTAHDPLRSMVQEAVTRCKSYRGEWKPFPEVGANISDFVGEPNNKITAESIKTRIQAALAYSGFINTQDMTITYMPVDRDRLLFRITFRVYPTPENNNSETIRQIFVYSYSSNNISAL